MVEKIMINPNKLEKQRTAKARIFIVEDEFIVSMDLKRQLEFLEYEVVGIEATGEVAIEKVLILKPDIILMDLTLAGELDGIETVKKIREKYEVPLIYITAINNKKTFDLAFTTNPSAYICKPFDITNLERSISIALERKSKFQNLEQKKKELINSNKTLTQEKEQAQKEVETQLMMIQEFTETQEHLIAATWREREMKQKLQETLDELELSKKIIEKQNKSILDSINYAKRIQKAIIPKLEDIRKDVPITDWMYKPKDVVSGDFPYYYKKGDLLYYAAVDCTGHGVPGAMMSLIGHLILNDILNDKEIYSPAEVLKKLHERVVRTLKQDNPENKAADGMDVAICCYNTVTKKLEYSGAHRPLYIVRKGEEIIQYKGGKYPVGGNQYAGKNTYPNHEIGLLPNDVIYFFSDGYPDQFGGEENLKFGPKRIRKLLEEHSDKSITENIEILSNSFDSWMGDKKQIDDVLFIGIKF